MIRETRVTVGQKHISFASDNEQLGCAKQHRHRRRRCRRRIKDYVNDEGDREGGTAPAL